MEQKINIAELLKDAPKGTILYSSICGECQFLNIDKDTQIIRVTVPSADDMVISFTKFGKYKDFKDAEITLFPSFNCRTWENFHAPYLHKHFKAGEKVLIDVYQNDKGENKHIWKLGIYSHYDDYYGHYVVGETERYADKEILSYWGNESLLGKKVEE